ncbi:TPA: ead/Ea22-like family protein [Enterobacter cloacae]|nr:ead/Ea22-like family protein [Enterobacter cloacae subsp. cloacae]HCE8675639.1 ead/Ea22-like family protein [Enterobacter cloacae]HCE9221407.1 ead/Ea22-like family protein [Enterobacter cloacae]
MSNIDKQALREAANAANAASWGYWESYKPHKGARGYEVKVGVKAVAQHCLKVDSVFIAAANPTTVLALLDELEAKDKRIAELSHHLQSAHAFIEHTEAFGHAASNWILCCGDAQWNIDTSKLVLAAAGKGE